MLKLQQIQSEKQADKSTHQRMVLKIIQHVNTACLPEKACRSLVAATIRQPLGSPAHVSTAV